MEFVIKGAKVYDTASRRFADGDVLVRGGRIAAVGPDAAASASASDEVVDGCGRYVLPGMVDVHTHGRSYEDFTDITPDGIRKVCASYARVGTTTVFGTLATAPLATMERSISDIAATAPEVTGKGAYIAGIHVEGRYLNVKRRGAHNPDLLAPLDADEIEHMLSLAGKLEKHVTCAAELPGGEAFVRRAVSCGATVGIGHTDSTYEEAMAALSWGVTSFTHTFNAMRGLHHREPGTVGAALTSDAYAEVICDGFHIAPPVIKLIYLAKSRDKLVLITDSMMATGCPDGDYSIAGLPVYVKDGKALEANGTIAGSTLNLLDGVFNFARFCGLTLEEALPYATINPAAMVGIAGSCGSVAAGKRADLLLLGSDCHTLEGVWCAGSPISLK